MKIEFLKAVYVIFIFSDKNENVFNIYCVLNNIAFKIFIKRVHHLWDLFCVVGLLWPFGLNSPTNKKYF